MNSKISASLLEVSPPMAVQDCTVKPDDARSPSDSARVAGDLGSYPGGKSGAGTYQAIINQQPPHTVFVSAFLGHCGILRNKRPANRNIGIDLDGSVIARWRDAISKRFLVELHQADAIGFLAAYPWTGAELVYLDPPYLMETRRGGRLYQHEMSDRQHQELLALVKWLPCMVQLSGYPSALYARELAGWRVVEFDAMTRRGLRRESLWMNYPFPRTLHTTWYAGSNYRERERIKRKRHRWMSRLAKMDPAERQVILEALLQIDSGTGSPFPVRVASTVQFGDESSLLELEPPESAMGPGIAAEGGAGLQKGINP
jgi:DNA adenine methylase